MISDFRFESLRGMGFQPMKHGQDGCATPVIENVYSLLYSGVLLSSTLF
jgi:hypothetical protein